MTQGFFHEVVLGRDLIGRVDASKGSFRSFLLHALNHYVTDEQRKNHACKRIPREKLVPLDIVGKPALPGIVDELDPEESFNYAWKADLLERKIVISGQQRGCSREILSTNHLPLATNNCPYGFTARL